MDIDMNGHRITGLPTTPLSSGEPITKGFVEKHYADYKNIITFNGKLNSFTVTHIDDMVDSPFNGRGNTILDFSKVGELPN